MALAMKEQESYTIADIYNLPDGQRAELIDGQMYMMAPPNRRHQDISYELSRIIGNYIHSRKGNCKVYPAPFAVFLDENDKTYVEPDISVICDKSKLNDVGCSGAPDWIIEIVSPGSQRMDYMVKLFKYHSAGVREYWIVDPEKKRITVYKFGDTAEDDYMAEYSFNDTVKVGIYEDFEISFAGVNG